MHVVAINMYKKNLKDKIIEATNADQCYAVDKRSITTWEFATEI
jgi:hypothetical protein